MSGVAAGFLVMPFWMAAMTKFELSYAYASMSLAFVLVLILSTLLLHETVNVPKVFRRGVGRDRNYCCQPTMKPGFPANSVN
jgi:hypothetical protein